MKHNRSIYGLLSIGICVSMLLVGCGSANPAPEIGGQSPATSAEGGSVADATQDVEYVALEVGQSDLNDQGVHKSEYALWSESGNGQLAEKDVPPEITVTFNGKAYRATYRETDSQILPPCTYYTHSYQADIGYFDVRADTGEVVGFQSTAEDSLTGTLTEDECRTLADAVADDYINISQYKVKVDRGGELAGGNCLYSFTYYQEVDGYMTADQVVVAVWAHGEIGVYRSLMRGSFTDMERSPLDSKKADEVIEKKIEAIYASVAKEDRTHKIKSTILARLEDGTVGLLYIVENSVRIHDDATDADIYMGSGIQLLVIPAT